MDVSGHEPEKTTVIDESSDDHRGDVWVICLVVSGAIGYLAGLLIASIHRAFEPERAPALMIASSSQYIYWIYGGLVLGIGAGALIAWGLTRTLTRPRS